MIRSSAGRIFLYADGMPVSVSMQWTDTQHLTLGDVAAFVRHARTGGIADTAALRPDVEEDLDPSAPDRVIGWFVVLDGAQPPSPAPATTALPTSMVRRIHGLLQSLSLDEDADSDTITIADELTALLVKRGLGEAD